MANWVSKIFSFLGDNGSTEVPTGKSIIDLIGVIDGGAISLADSFTSQFKEFTKNITSAANAGQVTVGTVGTGAVTVERIIVKSNGATTSDYTKAAITSGPSGNETQYTHIVANAARLSNIDQAGKQVSSFDIAHRGVGDKVVITLEGTGATAVNFDVIVRYSTVNGVIT